MKLEDLTKDELIWIIQARCFRAAADFEFDILMHRNEAAEQAASAELTQALSAREEYAKLLHPYSGKPLADVPASVIDEAMEKAKTSDVAMQRYTHLLKQSRSIQSRIDRILKKSESTPLPDDAIIMPEPKKTELEPDVPAPVQEVPETILDALPSMSDTTSEAPPLWSGFVHIRCAHCHKETTTCLRIPTHEYICRSCGQKMALPKPTRAYINCECGFNGRYLTNIGDWLFDIPCVCGMPNTVKYLPGKDVYVPANQGPKRLKFRGKH